MAAGSFYTIGHSTRPLSELTDMLKANGVNLLVDVRTVPKSRTNLQASRAHPAASCRTWTSDSYPCPVFVCSSTERHWSSNWKDSTASSTCGWARSWAAYGRGTRPVRRTQASRNDGRQFCSQMSAHALPTSTMVPIVAHAWGTRLSAP